jgi:hypothetical protein
MLERRFSFFLRRDHRACRNLRHRNEDFLALMLNAGAHRFFIVRCLSRFSLDDQSADTDEAGHAFQYEAGHLFRSEAGRGSDLMSATSVALPQIDLDDVSRFERRQAGWFFAAGERRLRRLSPESSIR